MLESDIFNHEMSPSQAKLVKCSLAMAGFSSDKWNILHIKHLFSAIYFASVRGTVLEEMKTVYDD